MLEDDQVVGAHCVCFCYDRDQIDSSTQSLHNLDIQRLQCVSSRSNKVETSMNSEIRLVLSLWLLLLSHVHLMLVVKEVNDGCPAVSIVDIVAKARCVDDSQLDLELLLLELGLDNVNFDCLVELLLVTKGMILSCCQFSCKQCVDHCMGFLAGEN